MAKWINITINGNFMEYFISFSAYAYFTVFLALAVLGDYFEVKIADDYKDIFHILLGAFLTTFTRSTDRWLGVKHEEAVKE